MLRSMWLGVLVSVGLVATAWAQSGSTGGSIGNDDKALSGSRQQLQSATPEQDRNACVVADPTGTPLNIRTSPNGKIVGRIGNGERVRISDQTIEDGKQWAYISNAAGSMGWVFRRFLNCR